MNLWFNNGRIKFQSIYNLHLNSPREMHKVWHIVVEVGEGDPVLGPNRLPNDDLIDVVKFIPILITHITVLDQRLKFRTSRNGHIQSFSCEEALWVEEVEEIVVHKIS